VGTEHILLGLLIEDDGVAARVLKNLGVNVNETRNQVLKELDPNYSPDIWKQEIGGLTMSEEKENNFTPRAQQVLALARKEADRLNHNFVGTEHLLLGLIKLDQGTAVNVLARFGIDLEKARSEVEKLIGYVPDTEKKAAIPYTPRVKHVLALAAKEAKSLNHTYVGTEHILLGLLQDGEGVAGRVLKNLRLDTKEVRMEILKELNPNYDPENEFVVKSERQEPYSDTVNITKRYDLYCREGEREIIYRNVQLKGIKRLFKKTPYDSFFDYVEIEQGNGQTLFLARSSIIKFCGHGSSPTGEIVPEVQQ
jgi:ATP-dependent Clp protease ATP-binding subunit ClpA